MDPPSPTRFEFLQDPRSNDAFNTHSSRQSTLQHPSFTFQSVKPRSNYTGSSHLRTQSCPAIPRLETPSLPPDHPSTPSFRFIDVSHNLKRTNVVSTATFRDFDQAKRRKVISSRQLDRLLEVFSQSDTPSLEIRDRLGSELGMSNREVQVWFQNRRAKVKRERQLQDSASTSQAAVPEETTDEPPSTAANLKWKPYIVSPVVPSSDERANTLSTSDRNELPLSGSARHSSTTYTQAPSDVPRYRKVFGERRISLPLPSLDPAFTSSPLSAASSTTSYFGTRLLPSPTGSPYSPATTRHGSCDSSTSSRSPWSAFGKLSLHSPSASSAERDPFFPHTRSEQYQEVEEEPIHLAPIVEFVVSSTSSLVSGLGRTHFPHSKSIHFSQTAPSTPCPASPALHSRQARSRRPSLELLLNPVFDAPPFPVGGPSPVARTRSESISSLDASGSRAGDVDENFSAKSLKLQPRRLSLPSFPSLFGSV
ncbi:hypothetical protein JCM5353_008346 [Sporobolomyces roseus]